MKTYFLSILFFFISKTICTAQTDTDLKPSPWTNHFQATVISQSHSGFKAAYSGTNSLADSVEVGATSITATLFLGRKLWKGASVYFNPEISGGHGLSYALGVAGALNGETYRVGNPEPRVFIARAYIQQHIPLGNTTYIDTEDDVNQIKDQIPANRITISAGKFSIDHAQPQIVTRQLEPELAGGDDLRVQLDRRGFHAQLFVAELRQRGRA